MHKVHVFFISLPHAFSAYTVIKTGVELIESAFKSYFCPIHKNVDEIRTPPPPSHTLQSFIGGKTNHRFKESDSGLIQAWMFIDSLNHNDTTFSISLNMCM